MRSCTINLPIHQLTCLLVIQPGWPDKWELWDPRLPYKDGTNTCLDCRSKAKVCKVHKQSPISLFRSLTSERICHDRHKMVYKNGDCARFPDMNFTVERHALRVMQPLFADGNSMCREPANIDFSMGFPDPWHLIFTDIKVPSEHMLDGKRYDAEVVLSHEYSHKGKNESFVSGLFLKAIIHSLLQLMPAFLQPFPFRRSATLQFFSRLATKLTTTTSLTSIYGVGRKRKCVCWTYAKLGSST